MAEVYPIIAGAVLGQAFALLYDVIRHVMGGSLAEFKPLKDLEATLRMLNPILIDNIKEHNKHLSLSNDTVEHLKSEMQEAAELVMKLGKCRNFRRVRMFRYTKRLKALDENLKGLIMELMFQETRDVKEVLKLVRELMELVKKQRCRKCDDYSKEEEEEEEEVKEMLDLAMKRRLGWTRLISMHDVQDETTKVELVHEEVDLEDEVSSHKYAAVAKAYMDLRKAVSEVNQRTKISDLTNYDIPLRDLKPLMEYISNRKRKMISSDVEAELENLKTKMEEGEKLVWERLTISQYNRFKCSRHCTKLDENSGHLQRMLVSIYVALSENSQS